MDQQRPQHALVVGQGSREHALVYSLTESQHFSKVYAAPGNPGIAGLAECIAYQNLPELISWCAKREPLLVIIGPEAPLVAGLADALRSQGHWVVGPSQAAAALEGSKTYAKEVMRRYNIPTARAQMARTPAQLQAWIEEETMWPHVMKQSGLAGGKGVVIVDSREAAWHVAESWTERPELFDEGILWEECLIGEEISVHVLTNGHEYAWLPLTRDYKRVNARSDAPNTGGMGAFGPVPGLDPETKDRINKEILDPVMQFLRDERMLYRGVLYVGLMLTASGPQVLEFNVRMGDPETEVIVPMVEQDWGALWMQLAQGRLPRIADHSGKAAVAVVLADERYPNPTTGGQPLHIPQNLDGLVFQGATRLVDGVLEGNGGRILTVVGVGPDVSNARRQAYQVMSQIDAPGTQYRQDIALEHRDS